MKFIYWNWLWFVNTYLTWSHHPYLFPSSNFFGFTQNLSLRFIFYMAFQHFLRLVSDLSSHNSQFSQLLLFPILLMGMFVFFFPVYRLYIHTLVSSLLLLYIFTSISVQWSFLRYFLSFETKLFSFNYIWSGFYHVAQYRYDYCCIYTWLSLFSYMFVLSNCTYRQTSPLSYLPFDQWFSNFLFHFPTVE